MPFEAKMVHGLSNAFLSDKPLFSEKADSSSSSSGMRRSSRTMLRSISASSISS